MDKLKEVKEKLVAAKAVLGYWSNSEPVYKKRRVVVQSTPKKPRKTITKMSKLEARIKASEKTVELQDQKMNLFHLEKANPHVYPDILQSDAVYEQCFVPTRDQVLNYKVKESNKEEQNIDNNEEKE